MSIVKRVQRTALFVSLSLLPSAAAHAQHADPPLSSPAVSTPAPRPMLLTPLYGSFIGLQALDFDSTMRAVRSGAGREANPVLQPIAGSPAALLALKAGTTAAIILAAERLQKDRHPVAAVFLMIGVNSAYAMVAAHNYRVLHRRH